MGRILESGHYYLVKGPTPWSVTGWEILNRLKEPGDKSLLYIDDVHHAHDVHPEERGLPVVAFTPNPDIQVLESQTREEALEILKRLLALSNGKRPKLSEKDNRWYCSGFPLTNAKGEPLCVLLDAGLTLLKSKTGSERAVNIVPCFYAAEQRNLLQIMRKAMPDYPVEVILYDSAGVYWPLSC